mmetsp:Transcript_13649/g.20625  ORF Transcript_13649/g.20625 Transcript_13649/m.20625 type:complete len:234 (-) Transcript_13649:221-922(-)
MFWQIIKGTVSVGFWNSLFEFVKVKIVHKRLIRRQSRWWLSSGSSLVSHSWPQSAVCNCCIVHDICKGCGRRRREERRRTVKVISYRISCICNKGRHNNFGPVHNLALGRNRNTIIGQNRRHQCRCCCQFFDFGRFSQCSLLKHGTRSISNAGCNGVRLEDRRSCAFAGCPWRPHETNRCIITIHHGCIGYGWQAFVADRCWRCISNTCVFNGCNFSDRSRGETVDVSVETIR